MGTGPKAALCLGLGCGAIAFAFLVASDARLYAGPFVALVLVSGTMAVLLFMVARGPRTESAMAGREAGGEVGKGGVSPDQNSIDADTPIGRFRIYGERGLLLFAIAAGSYFFYDHHKVSGQNHQEIREWSKNILEATQKNTRAIRAQTFVLTLSQERREKLNLEVPEEIREMQRHREP